MGNRVVYLAALVRDPSFPQILVKELGDGEVRSQCIYDCSVVFALSVFACYGGWKVPAGLDTHLTTVTDLLGKIRGVNKMDLNVGNVADIVRGTGDEPLLPEVVGKTEDELISLARPETQSYQLRTLAALALAESVTTSRNRVDLYVLAMNDNKNDASAQYISSIFGAIYRAETARLRSR